MTSGSDRKAWTMIAQAPTYLSAVILFVLMVMTFADVILRSAFNNPIESATELTRLFMAISDYLNAKNLDYVIASHQDPDIVAYLKGD